MNRRMRLAAGAAALVFLFLCVLAVQQPAIRSTVEGLTMEKCYADCDKLSTGERPACVHKCCRSHCEGAHRTTQGCKHYCHIEHRQRHTPRRILPHVSTHPHHSNHSTRPDHLAPDMAETAIPPASITESTPPPLASQHWPKVVRAKTDKPLGNRPFPRKGRLIVPSVQQLLTGEWK